MPLRHSETTELTRRNVGWFHAHRNRAARFGCSCGRAAFIGFDFYANAAPRQAGIGHEKSFG